MSLDIEPRTPLLEVLDVTVRFGGVVANAEVSLSVGRGEIGALIGPNGAGKTTLFNVITGAQLPTSGAVRFDGADITSLPPRRRARLGMARTFQNLSLVPSLDAVDNVTVGIARFRRAGLLGSMFRSPRAASEDARIRALASAALEFVGLDAAPGQPTSSLPYGDRRRLELARAVALSPRMLLLDEPTAGMDPSETSEVASVIRRIRDELGAAVLIVEHDMAFVRTLAERTTVLEFGKVIMAGATAGVLADERVAEAYLGTRKSVDA